MGRRKYHPRPALHPHLAEQSGYLHIISKCGLANADRESVENVVAVADEVLVLLLLYEHEAVSGRSPALSGVALTAERNVVTDCDSGRYLHRDRSRFTYGALAAAIAARIGDYLTFAATGWAGGDGNGLTEK